jgi:hypothetical protein
MVSSSKQELPVLCVVQVFITTIENAVVMESKEGGGVIMSQHDLTQSEFPKELPLCIG